MRIFDFSAPPSGNEEGTVESGCPGGGKSFRDEHSHAQTATGSEERIPPN
jgi:hypothetical protein